MKRQSHTYTLKVHRTGDGQLRIELRPLSGRPRYFKSVAELAAFLSRVWARNRQDAG